MRGTTLLVVLIVSCLTWARATPVNGATSVPVAGSTTSPTSTVAGHRSPAVYPRVIKIGVLSYRGEAETGRQWSPTADYLTSALSAEFPGATVVFVPFRRAEIEPAVRGRTIDFVLTQPAHFVQLEHDYGCRALATLRNFRGRDKVLRRDIFSPSFGNVIFARADRVDIQRLIDLRGKTFEASDSKSFGGWWVAQRELMHAGIDVGSLNMRWADGGAQDMVVYDVQLGKADAGTVRTDQLERMANEGSISLSSFRVLNPRPPTEDCPFLRSTELYPEWPLASLKILTPEAERIAKRVTSALLLMEQASPAAKASRSGGWTIPLDYTPVQELLKELRIRPFETPATITLAQATSEHKYLVIAACTFLVLSLATCVYVLRLNRRHRRLSRQLEQQLVEQRKAESALQESEAFYHSLVQHLPQSIIRKDLQGRFTFGNEKFCAEFAITPEKLKGKTDLDLFPAALAAKYRADDEAVVSTPKTLEAVEEHVDGNGLKLYVQVIKTPLRDAAGAIIGMQGIFWDVTDRKRAELQLEEQNRLLEQVARSEHEAHTKLMQAQATLIQTEKLAGLGQMVAGVAHEINNPLSFVSNNMAVLQRDVAAIHALITLYRQADVTLAQSRPELANEIQEMSNRVDVAYTMGNLQELTTRSREGLKRIQQIVKDLRDFARLDAGDLHEVDLNEGVESTVNIIRGRAKRKQVALEMKLSPLPLVNCYPAKINQVVMNLIANAIDACEEAGRVTVLSRPAMEGEFIKGVELVVTDTGSGIKPEIRDRIFDPFFTTKPVGEGTGLGLAISYGIIQDHGGTITVESEVGKGATFSIYLPKAAVITPEAASNRG